MKINKLALKRASTWANGIAMTLGAAVLYLPDLIPAEHLPIVMCGCSVVIAACQFIKQGGLEKLNDDS